jgi:hypothetical protein
VSNTPSFLQDTVVAGEPEEVQLRVKSMPESEDTSRDRIVTGAVERGKKGRCILRVGSRI